jgi:HEAT repeat protein
MQEKSLRVIEKLLASTNPEEVREGLELAKKEISRIGSDQARPLFEMVSTLFYIDPFERPDLVPILNEAISLVVGFGQWVIPALVQKLGEVDLKAEMASANALGRIGVDAIAPLVAEYHASPEPARRIFILYALSKIKSPQIVQAAPLALEAARSADRELRDTATRALGKFAESIPPPQLPAETRRGFFEQLHKNLTDENTGIRAKAVRSLGKLAKHGHLTTGEREKLKAAFHHLLGSDEQFEWDRAYVVRRQAEEALKYL